MRRSVLAICAFLSIAAAASWAQPKVAVLDAVVQKGIDSSVVVPVTEKVMERLVVSGKYTVLDRANVEQVLREREFQVSGLVSDAEITEAGKYLGADFVVVIKVQKIDTTYFLSAKMIAVKTGVISNQSSAESEGKLSVVIKLAEEAGDVLSGGKAQTRVADKPRKTEKTEKAPVSRPARDSSGSEAEGSVGVRLYGGLGGGSLLLEDSTGSADLEAYGVDLYAMIGIVRGFSIVCSGTYLDASEENGPTQYSFDLGVGYAIPLGILMPWAAVKLGYCGNTWDSAYYLYEEDVSSSALEFSFDVGVDVRFRKFLIGARYQFSTATFDKLYFVDLTSTQSAFWVMAGYLL